MIEVHFVPTPNGYKVTIMLEELGLPYRLVPYDILKGEHRTPEYREINPNGRLPAIVDLDPIGGGDPLPIMETGAILLYLSEKCGGALMPSDPRGRSLAQQWLMWQMSGLGPMHGQAHHFIRYAPKTELYGVERYAREAKRLFDVLERRLSSSEYLAGDYSLADIATWPWVRAGKGIDLQVEKFPAIARWFHAIDERPAVGRGTEVKGSPTLASARPELTPEEWQNFFGGDPHREGMHRAGVTGR